MVVADEPGTQIEGEWRDVLAPWYRRWGVPSRAGGEPHGARDDPVQLTAAPNWAPNMG